MLPSQICYCSRRGGNSAAVGGELPDTQQLNPNREATRAEVAAFVSGTRQCRTCTSHPVSLRSQPSLEGGGEGVEENGRWEAPSAPTSPKVPFIALQTLRNPSTVNQGTQSVVHGWQNFNAELGIKATSFDSDRYFDLLEPATRLVF